MDTQLTKFEKLRIAARYWLLGMAKSDPAYYKVLEAMELSNDHHNGSRNGGDPEFIHQLGIFHNLRTLHDHIRNPITVYILVFLHDAVEDPNKATRKLISLEEVEKRFGSMISFKVRLLSKEILGQPNPDYSLDDIFDDEDTAVVKSGDRVDNISSMYGVFKPARLERYVKETLEEFIPRIKNARRRFPDQEAVFENMKLELVNQLDLISHLMESHDAAS